MSTYVKLRFSEVQAGTVVKCIALVFVVENLNPLYRAHLSTRVK